MLKSYWTSFIFGMVIVLFSILTIVLICCLFSRNKISKMLFSGGVIVLIVTIVLTFSSLIIPCIKDYKFVSNSAFLEDEATVVDFMKKDQNLDGNGITRYSKPKFYIENKNEYIVLHTSDVEIGKKYRIRYLPNTRICEVLYCIDD